MTHSRDRAGAAEQFSQQPLGTAMRGRSLVGAIVVIGLVFGGALSPVQAAAAELPQSVQNLLPAAKAEGTLTVFGYPSNARQEAAFREGISKFYGFPINVVFSQGANHVEKTAQVLQALKHDVPTALDVFWSGPTNVIMLEEAGGVQKINWAKEFGVDADLQVGDFGLRTHDSVLAGISYNTSEVTPAEVPKSFEDLLNPKWKGHIATPRSPTPWFCLSYVLGDEKVTQLLTQLVQKQDLKLLPSYADERTRVGTGEFAIGIGTDAYVMTKRGAPIEDALVSPLVLLPSATAVLKDAKHPALAKLWGYWLVSDAGQHVLATQYGYGLVNNEDKENYTHVLAEKIGQWKVISYEYTIDHFGTLADKYRKIMGIR